MGTSNRLAGMEVPITGTDQLKWTQLSVLPSSSSSSSLAAAAAVAPPTKDSASCHIITGDDHPPTYLIWRIHESSPDTLEILELTASNQLPTVGLRLLFPHALSPFAFICQNQIPTTGATPYLLYSLSVSGVAYLFKLRHVSDYYTSYSIFPQNDFIHFDLNSLSPITSVAATMGCLVVGRHDGSVACFQLGLLHTSAQGFMHELRDVGIGRLWGLMARGRTVGTVQDLVISEVYGRKYLFVVHVDGCLRVWDLDTHARVLSHTISSEAPAGCKVSRLWVGDINQDSCLISLAILYTSMDLDMETIAIFSLRFNLGDRVILLPETMKNIHLMEGRFIDLIITSNKLWILKEDGLLFYNLFHDKLSVEEAHSYSLQEAFVADQLFQGSEHSLVEMSWTSLLLSPVKDQFVPFVSSIFLRRLLHPGIYQNAALRATALDYNKHWTDSEFQSLTIDGLKKEIFSLIEGEVNAPISVIYCWKNLCTRYFHYWCKNNAPYGLLVDASTGAVGLIRRNTVSLFRCLEDIELLIYGSVDEFGDFVNSGLDLPDDNLDREILFEVLRCISSISQQLGKAAGAILYESLVSDQIISSEELIPGFLKVLEVGYSSLVGKLHVSQIGADTAWKKELEDHRCQRKFSIDMLLSLHALLGKAASWSRVLNVIENYLKFLVPPKSIQRLDSEAVFSINSSVMILSSSQVARVMFESAFDIILLLGYLVNVRGQVHMMHDDISKIQLELIPMIQEFLREWLILHFLGTTPSESLALEDFSARLSSLHIDSSTIGRSWNEKLGTCDFTLACLLFLSSETSSEDPAYFSSIYFPSPNDILRSAQNHASWIIWGGTNKSSAFFNHTIELILILLRHGQYEAVEILLGVSDAHSRKEKTSQSVQDSNGEWCIQLHLLGFCLLARAQRESQRFLREKKVREAVRCFFRASSGCGASQALQSLSFQGLPHPGYSSCGSDASWKLHYYQWAMQIFEQYNLSEGACQFALAALEQVDEIPGSKDEEVGGDPLNEPATTVRGRLWANVFKFTLDLNYYYDAYCAIISNPDEESKYLCLRRFIIVLCERGAYKNLCDGQLPFVGLMEKMEQELTWKAERSDIAARPNPYKLLYAFEMHRHNWRRAASYMYRYSSRLRSEVALKEHQQCSMALQERLNGLSATINALNLVHPTHAWIDPQLDGYSSLGELYPNKKARKVVEESSLSRSGVQCWRLQYCIDIEKLEKEYVLTLAEYFLSLENIKLKLIGNQTDPLDLVDLLVQANLYDMAFTLVLKFWKGSGLKRELERVFVAVALKCSPSRVGVSFIRNDIRTHDLLLTSSEEESSIHRAVDTSALVHQSKGNSQWETLELYLEKYKKLHPRLPVIVAETLLQADPQIELPLWLVHLFKGGRKATSWGMTGLEADPASLFRLYVDYGRFTEATNLLLEYLESFASLRPADIINRKKMSAIWFPYSTIERLWYQLEEMGSSGHMIDQCDKLKKILRGALLSHLNQVKVDSQDAVSSAASQIQ
ncbi:hypothetical protein IFM89_037835 [Coptis chinensis]|uniref:Nuclear pore complex protein NUP160 n=1 Tax=Coptis chinensis TaxID=261450 RepID=A0A835HQR5_9MAGN|nr:hypothetical protein IFM89_037835 [Coptis chinensis]